MKKIIFIITVLISISCSSQQTISLSNYNGSNDLVNNNYIKDIDGILDKFVGTWEWNNGSTTIFRIKFVKVLHNKTSNIETYFEDEILGGYQYILNGVEVVNTLNFTTNFTETPTSYINFSPLLTSIDSPDFTNLHIIANDKIKNKSCGAKFTIQNATSNPLTAQWKLYNIEIYRPENLGVKPVGFSIPTNVVLTKLP